MLTAQVVELRRPTSTPGARRKASGMVVTPERRISLAGNHVKSCRGIVQRTRRLAERRDLDISELLEAHRLQGILRLPSVGAFPHG